MLNAVALLFACAASTAEPVDAASSVAPTPIGSVDEEPVVEGWASASEGYRLRTDGVLSDNDASVSFSGGASAFHGKLGLDVSGALFVDVDGTGAVPHNAVAFPSPYDAYGPTAFFVDNLELRYADAPTWSRVSAGRLTVDEGVPTLLDGVAARVTPLFALDTAWSLFASAGRTVHFFTIDEGAHENWTASIGGDALIAQRVKLEADWRAYVEDSATHRYQTSYGATYDQKIDDVALLRAWARGVDDELAYVGARAHVAAPIVSSLSVGTDASGIEQTATLGEVFEDENPFFAVLGPSDPNVRGFVDAWARNDFGVVDAGVHVGAAGRSVLRGAPGPFNRDFARAYVTLDADDIVVKGPFVSFIASYDAAVPKANGPRYVGIDPAVVAFGGTAGYRGDVVRASVGTSWDRTKYTYYRDVEELTDVRTVFASLDVRPLRVVRVQGTYTLELADRIVHTVAISLVQTLDGAL